MVWHADKYHRKESVSMNLEGPDSVAIFGSMARRDGDLMSDRDVLIVSDNNHVRRNSAAALRIAGWSPVSFTWQRLDRASAAKGLFVQHLKLEASILRDRDGRLRESFNRFSVGSEYDREVAGSKELLGVLEKVPNCLEGRYWALDVLSVGFRALGVATLANHGVYEFSLKRILNSLREIGVLKSGDRECLYGIREYKWRHRNSKLQRPISLKHTLKLVDLVSRRFRLGLHVRSIKADEALESVATDDEISPNWYLRSRVLERSLLALRPRASAPPEISDSKRRLQQLVREPSQYGWRIKSRWSSLRNQVRLIATSSEVLFPMS
jgi:hypothetical protein